MSSISRSSYVCNNHTVYQKKQHKVILIASVDFELPIYLKITNNFLFEKKETRSMLSTCQGLFARLLKIKQLLYLVVNLQETFLGKHHHVFRDSFRSRSFKSGTCSLYAVKVKTKFKKSENLLFEWIKQNNQAIQEPGSL